MAFNIEAARKDGIADADIANHLAGIHGFNIEAARADGISDTDIADHLAQKSTTLAAVKNAISSISSEDRQNSVMDSTADAPRDNLAAVRAGIRFDDNGLSSTSSRAMDIAVDRSIAPKDVAQRDTMAETSRFIQGSGSPRIADQDAVTRKPEQIMANAAEGTLQKYGKQMLGARSLADTYADFGKDFMSGMAGISTATGQAEKLIGLEKIGQQIVDEGDSAQKYWSSLKSDYGKDAEGRKFIRSGDFSSFGNAINTFATGNLELGDAGMATVAGQAIQSAPGMLAIGGVGKVVSAGLVKAGALEWAANLLGKIGIAQPVAEKAAQYVADGVAFGGSEGVFSGLQNAAQTGIEIRGSGFDKLKQSDSFNKYLSEQDKSLPEAERMRLARNAVASDAESLILRNTLITTGGISALSGGGVFGVLNRGKGTVAGRMATGAGSEFSQEFSQSGLEQYWQNKGKHLADPSQDLSEGVAEQAVQGGVVGGVLGLVGGGGAPTLTRAAQVASQGIIPTGAEHADTVLGAPDTSSPLSNAAKTVMPQRGIGALSNFNNEGFGNVSELADFANQERTDLDQRRAAIAEEQKALAAMRMNSDLESTDARVSGAESGRSRTDRLAALDNIYANPEERTPGMSFLAHLEKNYPQNPMPTPEEKRIIAQRESAYQAFNNAPDESASIEGQSAQQPVERTAEQKIAQVDAYMANGYKPAMGGRVLVNKSGKKLLLNVSQREYLNSLPQAAATAATSPAEQPAAPIQTEPATLLPESGAPGAVTQQQVQPNAVAAPTQQTEVSNVSQPTTPQNTRLDATGNTAADGGASAGIRGSDAERGNAGGAFTDAGQSKPVLDGVRDDAVTAQGTPINSAKHAENAQNGELIGQIKPIIEQLIKLRKNAGQVRLAPQLDIAVNKAKSVIKSGTGKSADFVKAAKIFKGKDAEIHSALMSIADVLKPATSQAKKPQKKSSDLLARIKQLGGIDAAQALDITGEKRGVGGWKFAFKNGGTSLDDLATMLAADGFQIDTGDVDGGAQQLRDMIRAHIGGERNFKASTIEAQAEKQARSAAYDAMATRAEELGINWKNLTDSQLEDAIYEAEDALVMARMDAEELSDETIAKSDAAVDEDVEIVFGDEAKTDDATLKAWLGESDEQTTGRNTADNTGSRAQEVPASNSGTNLQEAGAGQEVLQSYTNSEVLKREAAKAKAEEEASKEPPAKNVTADQADMFNGNGSLFNSNREPPAVSEPAIAKKTQAALDSMASFKIDFGALGVIGFAPFNEPRITDGHKLLSSKVIVRNSPIPARFRESGELPSKVYAWRVSAVRNKEGEIYSFVESMGDNSSRHRNDAGDIYAHFDQLDSYALDALERIAPPINKAAIKAYTDAVAAQSSGDIFAAQPTNPETSSAQAGNVKQADFVKAPDGTIDFGEITADMAQGMRRQSGKIRLERGNADYGLTHIENRHGDQIRALGFDSIESFISDAVSKVESIWSTNKTSQMVMIQSHERGKAVFIQLKPAESGDYYTVNTAFPVSDGYAENKKWEKLWGGESVPADASGASSFAEPALNAGEQAAMTSSQSKDNVSQPSTESKQSAISSIKASDLDAAAKLKAIEALNTGALAPEDVRDVVGNAEAIDTSPNRVEGTQENRQKNDSAHTIATHESVIDRVSEGDITADEFKAAFEELVKNHTGIIAELNAMTKAQIFKQFPSLEYRYKNEKKDRLIDVAYRSMLDDFVLSDSISYSMGQKYEDVIRGYVERTTNESLADYAEQVRNRREERAARRAEAEAGMDNPQTLEDYERLMRAKMAEMGDGTTFGQVRMTLTPEQREAYDTLAAEKSRGERIARNTSSKTEVHAAVRTTTGDIIETKHTKTGEPLFVVKAAKRVERDIYNQWNATAKRLGGWYSSFGRNGAVPGFQFKTRDNAEAFLKYLGGDVESAKEAVQTRRDAYADDRTQSSAERLTEMADALEEKADGILSADRKVNTARRARFAASAEAAANGDKAMAQTMRNIAQALTDGTAKLLDRVRQKVQVEMLQDMVRTAQYDMLHAKYATYAEQERHNGEKPTREVADYAQFPSYTAFRSDLANLGRALLETEGTKKLGQRMMKVADDVTDSYLMFAKENLYKVSTFSKHGGGGAVFKSKAEAEEVIARSGFRGSAIVLPFKRGENIIVLSPSEAMKRGVWEGAHDKRITLSGEFGAELVEAIGKAGRRGAKISVPWQFENAYDKRKRLAAMGIETPAELRTALREFIGLRQAVAAPDKAKELERAMIGRRNDGLDFFPTPAAVADEMIEAAGIEEGMSVLEPSAGMGHIADRIRAAGAEPDVVELSGDRRDLLEAKGYNLVGSDFMDIDPRSFTYGDTFKAPDGKEGIMRGSSGLGGGRVRLLDDNGDLLGYYDRDELIEVRKNGSNSGYDRILMNPPFGDRRDASHVQHAYDLLKPGGRLVAIMGEGVFFGQDAKAKEFRDWLDSVGGTEEKLPDGTFLDPSLPVNTGVAARMVVIEKAEGEAPLRSVDGYNVEKMLIDKLGAIHPDIDAFLSIKGDLITLSELQMPKDIRGQGLGSRFMDILTKYADQNRMTIALSAAGDFGGSRAGQERFYKRFDFVTNKGRNKDYRIRENMLRRPKEPASASTSQTANTSAQTVASVKQATQVLRNRWLGFRKIEIVQHDSDLPQEFRDRVLRSGGELTGSEGWFDPKANTVYLVADNLASSERAVWVAVHEVVGHGGVRMLGKSVAEALEFAGKNSVVQRLAKAIALDRGEEFSAKAHTDEALAELAAATITDDVDAIMDRYGVNVPASLRNNLLGMVNRVVDAVRKFIAKVLGRNVESVSDADVYGLLSQMREAVEGKTDTAAHADGGYALASSSKVDGERFARLIVEEFVAENDSAFRFPVSVAKSLEGVIGDVMPEAEYHGEHTREDERQETGADHRFVFTSGYGKKFYVYMTDSGKVWIDVSRFEPNERGQAVYAAVANYAYNANKKFVGDPVGVSRAAVIRRTSNMLSSALRFGTTRHLEASKEQIKGDVENGIEPLDWTGSDIDKVEALIHTFITTTKNLFPEVKNVTYDFSKHKFIDRMGKPIDREGLQRIGSESDGRKSGSGEATIRRAAFLQSLVSSKGSERSGILEQALSWLNQAHTAEADLDGLFSKAQAIIPGTAQPPAQPPRQGSIQLQGVANGNNASWDAPESTILDNIIYKMQDKNIDLKRVLQSIRETGAQVAQQWDAYLSEELFHGRAAKRTQDFVNTELKPLLVEMQARGVGLDELDEYLHARHAKEANALIAQRDPNMQDGGSGMTDQQADDYFANLPADKRKKLEAAAKRVDAIIAKTRELYVSYGLVSRNQAAEWGNMFQHYVPLMREDNDGGMGIGQGFSIKGKEVKHRTGSTAAVVDILANIALQREKAITRGEKNRVAVSLAGLAKLNPNPDFWTFGKPPTERVLNEKTGMIEERIDPMFKIRNNVVVAKIKDSKGDIQERAVIFNEHNERAMRMSDAIHNYDTVQLPWLLAQFAKVTRYFASINTQYNPVFGATNIVRDVQGMLINLDSTKLAKHKKEVLKHVGPAIAGIFKDVRAERKGHANNSVWSQLWEELQDEGGMTGYRDLYRNSQDRAKAIERELDPHGWTNSTWGKVFTAGGILKAPLTKAQDMAAPLFGLLDDYNQTLEGATRLSVYKVALDNGLSKAEAASLAKNITVNFNRKGQVGQQAGALYAFFNASMQGTARIGKTIFAMDGGDIKTLRLNDTGKKVVYGGIMLGAMQAIMLAAAGFGDDEPPEFMRERNLIIPIPFGGKKYITIPMPLGFHVIPNIGRVSAEFAMSGFKHPEDRVISLFGVVADGFNPIGNAGVSLQTIAPTSLDPLVAISENKDWTGKPIAKPSFDKIAPGFSQNKDTATMLSKLIAEGINFATGGDKYVAGAISPTADQLDYLAGQVGGGVWREGSKAEQAVMSMFSGEEFPTHKIPLLGRFYGDSADQSSQGGTFYANLQRIKEARAGLDGRRKDRLPTDEFIADNPDVKLIGRAKYAEKIVQNLNKRKRMLIEQDAPREKIKLVEERITAEMLRFNQAVDRQEAMN